MDSYELFRRANQLVLQCETRDALRIAKDMGIWVYYEDGFKDLLGMYTFQWNHRLMFLNAKMSECMTQMVAAHEIGHDVCHRALAKANGMREFTLFSAKDNTEYEANAFAAHILLDNDEVYSLARQGYDVAEIAQAMNSHVNLMLIKMQEMIKMGYDFSLPYYPDGRFFRNIKGSDLAAGGCYD